MAKYWVWIIVLIAIILGLAFLYRHNKKQVVDYPTNIINITHMQITSSAFENNQPIPAKFTCQGDNVNPPLQFSDIPAGAKSIALIMHDPDAPRPGGFTHWVIYNIPTTTSSIAENSVPAGIQGLNDRDQASYTGPCPPSGTHHYYFYLYALDTILQLAHPPTKNELEQAMTKHIISQSELMGTYEKH